MGGFSLWHWLIVLLVVVLIFGTKRLGNTGKDLGTAIKEFKKSMRDADSAAPPSSQDEGAAKPQDDDRTPPAAH